MPSCSLTMLPAHTRWKGDNMGQQDTQRGCVLTFCPVHGHHCKDGRYSRTWISSLVLAGYALSNVVLTFAQKGALREGISSPTQCSHEMWIHFPWSFCTRNLILIFTLIQSKTNKMWHLFFSTELYWAAQPNSWKLWKRDKLFLSHR